MKLPALLLILLVSILTCSGQFKPNAIGVVYLTSNESRDTYVVTLVLPVQMLENTDFYSTGDRHLNDTLAYEGYFTFFDTKGELATLMLDMTRKQKFTMQRWCDTDGSYQYRPTFRTEVLRMHFKRVLKSIDELQGICCFVMVNRKGGIPIPKPVNPVTGGVRLRGDRMGEGQADCLVWTCYHKDNCSGKETNYLDINLQVGADYFPLHCCGQKLD